MNFATREPYKHEDPELFLAMDDLELVAHGIVEGALHGMHRSPYVGFSVEFDSHREYQYGDDLRHVNWNLWARTNELYIKQFEADTNLNLYLLLDKSGSMSCENGSSRKWDYASRAVAALSFLSLANNDAAGLYLLNNRIEDLIPPKVRPGQLLDVLAKLHNNNPAGEANMSLALTEIAETCKRKGIIIFFTDFFDKEDDIIRGLTTLRHMGHEVIVMQVLDPWEKELPESGQFEFRDLESNEKIVAYVQQVRDAYGKIFEEWRKDIKLRCESNGIEFFTVQTTDPLRDVLIDYLIKRAKVY